MQMPTRMVTILPTGPSPTKMTTDNADATVTFFDGEIQHQHA